MTTNLLDSVKAADVAGKKAAAKVYRTLLARAARPKKEDPQRLRTVMHTLDITSSMLERDLRLVRKARELEKTIAAGSNPQFNQAASEASAAVGAHDRETQKIEEKRRRERGNLLQRAIQLQGVCKAGHEARIRLDDLREKHATLFGVDLPEPEPPQPENLIGTGQQNYGPGPERPIDNGGAPGVGKARRVS